MVSQTISFPAGTYTFYGFAQNASGGHYWNCGSGTVTVLPLRPSLWSWTSSNGSASALETQQAYWAVTKVSGYGFAHFSHKVWNDLVDKTKAVCDTLGVGWNNYYATIFGTYASSGTPLYAYKFNSLINNINILANLRGISQTGITAKAQGDLIYGQYFLTMALVLNNIIVSI